MGEEDKKPLKIDSTWLIVAAAAAAAVGAFVLARSSKTYDSVRAVPMGALCAELARRI
jgi:hypothetical protein